MSESADVPADVPMTDARGYDYDNWMAKVVETPHGVGSVVEVDGDMVRVNHEYPTYGRITGYYSMNEVAVVETPGNHPAFTSGAGYRKHDEADLEAMEEPTLYL